MKHKGKSGFFKAKKWMTLFLRLSFQNLFEAFRLPHISDAIKVTVLPKKKKTQYTLVSYLKFTQ